MTTNLQMLTKRVVFNLVAGIILVLVVFVALGGGPYLWCHLTGHPYYTELGTRSGLYCIDHTGWMWGYPPGYIVTAQVPTPDWYDDPSRVVHYMNIETYNQSAWVPANQWPSCKEYGES